MCLVGLHDPHRGSMRLESVCQLLSVTMSLGQVSSLHFTENQKTFSAGARRTIAKQHIVEGFRGWVETLKVSSFSFLQEPGQLLPMQHIVSYTPGPRRATWQSGSRSCMSQHSSAMRSTRTGLQKLLLSKHLLEVSLIKVCLTVCRSSPFHNEAFGSTKHQHLAGT